MNREVCEYIDKTVIKIFHVIYDDLSNLFTPSIAAAEVISILKNILSLPKRNSYISVEDFSSLLKSIIYQHLA